MVFGFSHQFVAAGEIPQRGEVVFAARSQCKQRRDPAADDAGDHERGGLEPGPAVVGNQRHHQGHPDALDEEKGEYRIVNLCAARSASDYEIPSSINIPLERLRSERLPFDKNEPVILYSRTSAGAYKAFRYLSRQGYTNLRVLEGGFLFWKI